MKELFIAWGLTVAMCGFFMLLGLWINGAI
jgi:hypothetical protein